MKLIKTYIIEIIYEYGNRFGIAPLCAFVLYYCTTKKKFVKWKYSKVLLTPAVG